MITSLNVNQFLKNYNWKNYQGKNQEKMKIWQEIEDFYYNYIKKHLIEPEDLIILQEVPYNNSDIYTALEEFCENNGLEIIEPSKKGIIITIAICKKGEYRKLTSIVDNTFKDYLSRIIALERKDEIIIGVHIPRYCPEFWDQLIELHEKLPKDKILIYIGDCNTYSPNTVNKNKLYEFLSKGLVDVWLESGNPHTKETFAGKTRVDCVFMTGKDFRTDKYKMIIDDTIREKGISDHSAIIFKESNRYKIYFDNIRMLDFFLRHIEVNHELDGTTTYKYNPGYLSPDRIEPVEVEFPNINKSRSWEVLRAVSFGGFNNCPPTEEIVTQAKAWYEKYGAYVSEITHDTVKFAITDSLDDENISNLKDEILRFAPNSIEFYKSEADMVKRISNEKCFYLWYD